MLERVVNLSRQYEAPPIDALLIELNRLGVCISKPNYKFGDRVMFELNMNPLSEFDSAFSHEYKENDFFLTLTINPDSPFILNTDSGTLEVDSRIIGKVEELQDCGGYLLYTRDQGRVLHLDPKLKSNCNGCDFCHFGVASDLTIDLSLNDPKTYVQWAISQYKRLLNVDDFSDIEQVAVVTGCFKSAMELLTYLDIVRQEFSGKGFKGELFYLGSELRSEDMSDLCKLAPITYCHSTECFANREQHLHRKKSSVTIPEIVEILKRAKEKGINTTFTYVLGLDPVKDVIGGMKQMLAGITRVPVTNIFQRHSQGLEKLWAPGANDLPYYLEIRRQLGEILGREDLKPERPWEDYRGLWYTEFQGSTIIGTRLPGRSKFHYKEQVL